MSQQLALNVGLRHDATFDNFYFKQGEPFISALCSEPYTYLWGGAGVGKTHLLQATCRLENPAVFLSFNDDPTLSPEMLEGLEFQSLVCLDDIQTISGKADWEEAIFHLYNRLLAQKNRLIISGDAPPQQLSIELPDLKSRLSAGLVLQIKPLTDEDKLKALQLHAKTRGLILSETLGHYLLNRCDRKMSALIALLNKLDQASLMTQRRLTIPFVKAIL